MRRRVKGIPPSIRGEPASKRGLSFKTIRGPGPLKRPWVFTTRPKFARVEQFREPLVDVFEEADEINIILHVPGFKEEEIQWEVKEGALKLLAKSLDQEWEEMITLPSEVDEEHITAKYRNAILQITLVKKELKNAQEKNPGGG